MTRKEIFDAELDNKDRIYLYLEGTFWKAYERSAFRFVKEVKPYVTKKKYVKIIGQEMVALGFPDSFLAEVNKRLSLLESSEKTRVFKAKGTYAAEEFDRWKSGIPLTVPQPEPKDDRTVRADRENDEPLRSEPINEPLKPAAHENLSNESEVISMLKGFNIESKTPMECMLFLSKLKNKVM